MLFSYGRKSYERGYNFSKRLTKKFYKIKNCSGRVCELDFRVCA